MAASIESASALAAAAFPLLLPPTRLVPTGDVGTKYVRAPMRWLAGWRGNGQGRDMTSIVVMTCDGDGRERPIRKANMRIGDGGCWTGRSVARSPRRFMGTWEPMVKQKAGEPHRKKTGGLTA
ncbi:hypothetical protein JB92DRAFT_2832888 [Gautieria morchelliformis]|nr:hypothetical protein JB92DRAFT_2832888 [Gautieria morchelliformis]